MNKKETHRTVEVEATTVEGAIRKAVKTLKVVRDEVTVKVLKEEKKGLFGMEGAARAKIKVTLKKANS